MSTRLTAPKAYKRSTSLENSTWYKGILVTQLAGETDTGGAFDFTVAKMRKGTEPPPVGRVGEAEDIAQAYLFLMQEGFSTGQTVVVDGGTVLV